MHIEKANAKINLVFDIKYKRDDGYHEISTIMQSLELHDRLVFEKQKEREIVLDHNVEGLPKDKKNLICKAAIMMSEKFSINEGMTIQLEKNIPISAGLGGGSSDAASVIKAYNKMFTLGLMTDEMESLGKELGADVPFFIRGGLAKAEGIGEKLELLDGMEKLQILLVKPDISVSTAWVYNNYKVSGDQVRPDVNLVLKAVKTNDVKLLTQNIGNVLESVTVKEHPIIKNIKDNLLSRNAIGALMSGSGPTVFAVYDSREKAKEDMQKLDRIYKAEDMNFILTTTE